MNTSVDTDIPAVGEGGPSSLPAEERARLVERVRAHLASSWSTHFGRGRGKKLRLECQHLLPQVRRKPKYFLWLGQRDHGGPTPKRQVFFPTSVHKCVEDDNARYAF